MERFVRGVSACLLVLSGCASISDPAQAQAERQYRTGSNIAQRDHAMKDSVQTKQVDTSDPNLGLPNGGRLPRSFGGGF